MSVTFPAVPISSIMSSVRLGVMLSEGPEKTNKERNPPRQGWKHLKEKDNNPFADSDSPKEEISTILRSKKPADSPSDGSDSDDSKGDKPPKISPWSSKWPSAVPLKSKEEVSIKTYHFDIKLKPETVPTWDENENTLAQWIEKVEQWAGTSLDIFKELEKIVPWRFTNSAEVWYYSISSKDRQPLEQDWGTLKSAIADYWINHSWLEEQKFWDNNAHYWEAGHARETPSEYVISKIDLIRLVYNYTDSEIVQLIIKEAPDSWSSLLQPNLCQSVMQFQKAVKYHESTLLVMHRPQLNVVTQFPNRAFQSQRFHPRKAHMNMVGWTPSLEPPKFPKDDKNVSSRKTLDSVNARRCRHCGSGKHWDYECKYSRKGEWQARTNYVSPSDPDIEALNAYDDLYYELESGNESKDDSQESGFLWAPPEFWPVPSD